MVDYGYISVQFYKKDIKIFQHLVKNVCNKNDFYYSDVIDYIQGDVSSGLHLTIFYGLINNQKNESEIKKKIKKTDIKSLNLGKVFFMPGYKSLYKSLCVEILDDDKNFLNFSESFKSFNYDPFVQLAIFRPHLTLAYVKPNCDLKGILMCPSSIKIKVIKYFEK